MRVPSAVALAVLLAACSSNGGSDNGPCDTSGPATALVTVQSSGGECVIDRTFTFTHPVTAADLICQRTANELKLLGWQSEGGAEVSSWEFTVASYTGEGEYRIDSTTSESSFGMSLEPGVVACSPWLGEVWLNPSNPGSTCTVTVTSDCHTGGGDGGIAHYRVQGTVSCTVGYQPTPTSTFTVSGSFDFPNCFGG